MIKYEILIGLFILINIISYVIVCKIKKITIWYAFLFTWLLWLVFSFVFAFVFKDYEIANMIDSYKKDMLFTIHASFIIEPMHHFLALASLIFLIWNRIKPKL